MKWIQSEKTKQQQNIKFNSIIIIMIIADNIIIQDTITTT